MQHRSIRLSATPLVAVATLALAFGLPACSGDDGDADDSGASAATQRTGSATADPKLTATSTGSDREQIEATLRYMRAQFNAGNGEAFCAKLTHAGRAEVVQFGEASQPGQSCAQVAERFSKLTKQAGDGQWPVVVRSVDIRGDEAVVRSKGGLAGRTFQPLRMVKENAEWRVIDPLSGPTEASK